LQFSLALAEKSKPKGARHSKPAVVCRAAAEADNDFARAVLRRIQNHLANAECVRAERIAFTFGKPSHTGGFAHFHYGNVSVFDPSVTRVDLASEQIVRVAF
jgi:hypothetical protein